MQIHGITDYEQPKHSEKNLDKEKKVMECEFCDRKFKYKKSFAHHMQTEHGMSDDSDVPLSTYVVKNEMKEDNIVEEKEQGN